MSLENVKQRVLVISRHLCTHAYSSLLQCHVFSEGGTFSEFLLKIKGHQLPGILYDISAATSAGLCYQIIPNK